MKLSILLSAAPLLAVAAAQAVEAPAAPPGAAPGTAAPAATSPVGAVAGTTGTGVAIDVNDPQSVIAAAAVIAKNLRALYPNTEPWFIPGQFGLIQTADGKNNQGYYWWEAGAAMGAWIDYWALTGDSQYNDIVSEALQFQVGPSNDYQPPNQTLALGNDDQGFWAIAVLSAAERGFPDPPKDKPQWLALAQAVFNRQTSRWDAETCGGGLRWQVTSTNSGYDYKNTVSNGLLFQIGARLAHYTGNTTYLDWSDKVYTWIQDMGLVAKNYTIYDGSQVPECQITGLIQWSYNYGILLSGTAYMYDTMVQQNNTAGAAKWQLETQRILNASEVFLNSNATFKMGVMWEPACEAAGIGATPTCNTDQRSFKGYLARFLAQTYQIAPFARDQLYPWLQASAAAAAASCSGSVSGTNNVCGLSWRKATYDGAPYGIAIGGVGEHMSAMEVIQSLLVKDAKAPVTQAKGGTSMGNVNAGTGSSNDNGIEDDTANKPTTTADRAGAGILTTMCLGALLALTYWLLRE